MKQTNESLVMMMLSTIQNTNPLCFITWVPQSWNTFTSRWDQTVFELNVFEPTEQLWNELELSKSIYSNSILVTISSKWSIWSPSNWSKLYGKLIGHWHSAWVEWPTHLSLNQCKADIDWNSISIISYSPEQYDSWRIIWSAASCGF